MARRGENIRKRKDGRWEARYPNGKKENGEKRYASVYGKTYREVKEKRQLLIQQSNASQTKAQDSMLYKDVLQLWQEANRVRLKGATTSRYQYLIDTHILPELGGYSLDALSISQINSFLSNKLRCGRIDGKGGLSPAYVRSIAQIINASLCFAAMKKLCSLRDFTFQKPSLPKKELTILSKDQQCKLEATLLQNTERTKLGVLISLYTGMRIGEVCALSWDDIDLTNRVIYVRHTVARIRIEEQGEIIYKLVLDRPKTSSSVRCIPLCSKLYDVLKKYPHRQISKYVVSDNISFANPRTYEYRYRKLLNNSGIPYVNYHVLRHTFATRCIEKNVDVKSLSEILGHSNVSITLNTYVHSSIELKRAQLEKLVV